MKKFIRLISVIVLVFLTFSASVVNSSTISDTVTVHDLSFISGSIVYDYPVAGTLTVSAAVTGNADVVLIAIVYKRATGEIDDISISQVTTLTSSTQNITTKIEVGAGEYPRCPHRSGGKTGGQERHPHVAPAHRHRRKGGHPRRCGGAVPHPGQGRGHPPHEDRHG